MKYLGGIKNSNFHDAWELIDRRIHNMSTKKRNAQSALQTKVDPKERLAQLWTLPLLTCFCVRKDLIVNVDNAIMTVIKYVIGLIVMAAQWWCEDNGGDGGE